MAQTKYILRAILEMFGFFAWTGTILDMAKEEYFIHTMNSLSGAVEGTIKTCTALFGLIYFALRIRQYKKETELKNQERKLDLEMKQHKIDMQIYNDNKLKTIKNIKHKNENDRNST